MINYIMPFRYVQPIEDLLDLWWVKFVSGVFLGVMATPEHLPAIILILFVMDVFSGIRYSQAVGKPIRANRLRKIIPKASDFIIFIIAATAFSKIHPSFEMAQTVAYSFVGLTLLKSIAENLSGAKSDPDNIYNHFIKWLRKKNPLDFFDHKEGKDRESRK